MEGSCWVMIDIVQKGTSPSCGKQENDVEPNFDEVRLWWMAKSITTLWASNQSQYLMVLELTPDLMLGHRIEVSQMQHLADHLGSSPPPPTAQRVYHIL